MTLALAMRTSRMGNVLRLAVLALPLCLRAAPSPAQTAPPAAPSVAELAKLVADQGEALAEQKREIAELRKQLEETKQLSLSANNRLAEMAKAPPAPTVSAAVEERLAGSRRRCSRSPTCRRTWWRPATSRARSASPAPTSG